MGSGGIFWFDGVIFLILHSSVWDVDCVYVREKEGVRVDGNHSLYFFVSEVCKRLNFLMDGIIWNFAGQKSKSWGEAPSINFHVCPGTYFCYYFCCKFLSFKCLDSSDKVMVKGIQFGRINSNFFINHLQIKVFWLFVNFQNIWLISAEVDFFWSKKGQYICKRYSSLCVSV